MEPFTLHCTTCRARLKVKDESVVGSILNCPRCGSMVHVVPPVDWKSDSGAAPIAAASTIATESSITLSLPLSTAQAALASVPPPPTPPQLPKAVAASAPAAVAPPVPEAPSAATNEVELADEAVVEQAGVNWLSSAATWLRGDGLIWVGGLSAGVVVGAVTWFVMTSFTSTPQASPEIARPVQVAQAEAPETPSEAKQAPAVESAPVPAAPAPDTAPAEPTPARLPLAAEPSQVTTDISPTEPPVAKVPEASAVPPAPETTAPVAAREPSLKLDPAAAPPADSAADDATVDGIVGADSASEPSAADTADADASVDKPAARANADEPVAMTQEDVEAALAVKLDQVKFVSVPLAQFVEFIGDTSALSISVDDAALAKVGKKRTMPLSVHLSDTTAQEALHAAISPLGLVCELRGNRLFVTVPGK